MGNLIIEATSTKATSGSSLLPLLLVVLLVLVVYTVFSRRNRARQAGQMQSGLAPGTQVRTTSGIYGTITSAEDNNDVMLEISPGVSIRVMRRAIVQAPQDLGASNGAAAAPEPDPAQDGDAGGPDADDARTDDARAEDLDSQERNV